MANLSDVAKNGNKKETLIALRDILAITIQNCESGRDMASNTKRFMEVIDALEEIEKEEEAERERLKLEALAQKNLSKHDRLKKKHEAR